MRGALRPLFTFLLLLCSAGAQLGDPNLLAPVLGSVMQMMGGGAGGLIKEN